MIGQASAAFLVSLLVVVAIALGAGGCRGVQRPAVEVGEAAVTQRTAEGARIELSLRLGNPNEVLLPVKQVRYRFTVEGLGVFATHEDPAVTLPPGEHQTIALAAAFGDDSQSWEGRRYEVFGEVSYLPPGRLRELLDQYRVPPPVVQFTAEGELREAER